MGESPLLTFEELFRASESGVRGGNYLGRRKAVSGVEIIPGAGKTCAGWKLSRVLKAVSGMEKPVRKGGEDMTKRETYESRTEAYLLPLLAQHGFTLWDVEYVKEGSNWYLRAYIDKEGGITVDDCELISRPLSDWLDREDFIDDSYILEVSSPGLGRPLKKNKDFERSIGQDVEVRLFKPVDRQKEFAGTLKAYDNATVTITLEDGTERTFERAGIALIRLAFDF